MNIKITDLEKFAFEEIIRPYKDFLELENRPEKNPYTLEEISSKLINDLEWSELVLTRIFDIGVYFPSYINHPIVTIIETFKKPCAKQTTQLKDKIE